MHQSALRSEPNTVSKATTAQKPSPEYSKIGPDPLSAAVPLPHQVVLFPYGFPLKLKSNSATVIRVAERAWGHFVARFREEPIELRFIVDTGITRRRQPAIPQLKAQSNLLTIIADRNNFASGDLAAGFGVAFLSQAAVSHAEYLRRYFLEALIILLLDTRHVIVLHAACLAHRGHGFLFVGDSGAGKSTLSYACARRGWTYLTDDMSLLARRRRGRVVLGNPHTIRFRPTIATLFPEISGPTKLRNGKPTIEGFTEKLGFAHTAHECEVEFVVFLKRSETPVEKPYLVPDSRETALRRLLPPLWPEELPIHEERFVAVESALEAQPYEFFYSDLNQAIDSLEEFASRGTI
jgi:hypothetical protein